MYLTSPLPTRHTLFPFRAFSAQWLIECSIHNRLYIELFNTSIHS